MIYFFKCWVLVLVEEVTMGFGEKVRELRKGLKLSQSEFGGRIGIHEKHVSKIESQQLVPYADTIKKIAEVLGVSTDYLLFDDVPKNTDISKVIDSGLVDLIFQIDQLSEEDRITAKNVLEALVTKNKVDKLLK